MELNPEYWNKRYTDGETGWDLGAPAPPLKRLLDSIPADQRAGIRVLIPGCGKAYEGEYAHSIGFNNIFLADYAPLALQEFSARVPDFPNEHLLQGDFFELKGQYDLIIEQTFFCAIDPELRDRYVEKMAALLLPGGILAGLLFNDPLNTDHPPYGGSEAEYRKRFGSRFNILEMQTAPDSIPPRAGRELFFRAQRKN